MASVVDICNAALSHIGDSANVASIDPPDGSMQAAYCATFYPLALGALIEMADWGFSTRRSVLAAVDNPSSTWGYAYACPSDAVNLISVLPSDALDDYSQNFAMFGGTQDFAMGGLAFPDVSCANSAANFYTPQTYAQELDAKGNQIILTNCPNAVLRYNQAITDPTGFSPLFTLALSYLLASMLAGPIIKGEAGATMSSAMLTKFQAFESQAESSDASQARIIVQQSVPWMAGR